MLSEYKLVADLDAVDLKAALAGKSPFEVKELLNKPISSIIDPGNQARANISHSVGRLTRLLCPV